ncbi:type I DNA topoisomerase [Mesomycoplasma flocculare]|uniref:type I DNA topoisomerase n=1 Tax=Mesomycoplasma flocculare TaxID=2128 RepID=UPI00136DACC3|nr:type I DNA topoisomerase [Mesomycoplasma flocculare]MXR12468.1 type I DNA topoisomerase [Mesomycoplasma flocculare]MXR22827.1 type I DNA topoisomerase [Mesomycoplasma flocculare]
MEKLIIVESPNKINTISSYLDSTYKVTACVGHIANLAKTGQFGLGIDLKTWTPSYVLDKSKKKIIGEIKKLAKQAKTVIIATDADREGEAIGASLVEYLQINDKYQRIKYNEITKSAILYALENPGKLDQNLINSQQTRRMLDRIIGFRLTALLKNKIKNPPKNPAAGRVQSFGLRLIFDREKEIKAFKAETYFNLSIELSDQKGNTFEVSYHNLENEAKKSDWINSEDKLFEIINEIKENPYLIFTKFQQGEKKDVKVSPLKQATVFKKMAQFPSSLVANALQKLYEGFGDYGLISYPRTDSTRLSQTFIEKAKEFISKNFGQEYFAKTIKGFSGDQDAHEAIRPTNLELTPELAKAKYPLTSAELQIYQLIYTTTIEALMEVPIRKITRLTFKSPIKQHIFIYSYSEFLFDGYYKATELPKLKFKPEFKSLNDLINKEFPVSKKFESSIKSSKHKTNPPAHFNDGTLIEKLDDEKVGRPSTFAVSIKKLKDHLYVITEAKSLILSQFGEIVYENLAKISPEIIEAKFTADVEEELDLIAQGKQDYKKYLDSMWSKIENIINEAKPIEKVVMEIKTTGEKCPECGANLVYRHNRKTSQRFIGCDNFPKCRFLKPDLEMKKVAKFLPKKTKE